MYYTPPLTKKGRRFDRWAPV